MLKKNKNKNRTSSYGNETAISRNGGASRLKPKFQWPRFINESFDFPFFIIIIVLLVFGLAMVFSASYMEGMLKYNDAYKYIRTQGKAAIAGFIVMFLISAIDYHWLFNSGIIALGYLAGLGALCYTTLFGNETAGARRWINLFGQSFQTSEAVKPILVVVVAYLVVRNQKRLGSFVNGSLPLIFVIAPILINMLLQRHISGLAIMLALACCVILISDMPLKQFFKMVAVLGVVGVCGIVLYSYIKGGNLNYIITRFESMGSLDEVGITDENWQLAQSLIAIGSGGWFGLGFGESRQKYLWLPESQNDFIISIIVEELGYIGGLVVIVLFTLLVIRGFSIARRAPDKFGMLVAAGLTFHIGLQAILNIGVACDAFPNTGVALPFFSSGGTALAIQLVEMGVVLAISRQAKPEFKGVNEEASTNSKNTQEGEENV